MSNSISTQISVTSTVDDVRTVISSNNTTNTSSSNFIAGAQEVTSSTWTEISLGSLDDVAMLTIVNDDTVNSASVIAIGTGSAGQNTLAVLLPSQQCVIPWSGSLAGVYAKVVSAYPNVDSIALTASLWRDATVQWIAQQS